MGERGSGRAGERESGRVGEREIVASIQSLGRDLRNFNQSIPIVR